VRAWLGDTYKHRQGAGTGTTTGKGAGRMQLEIGKGGNNEVGNWKLEVGKLKDAP